MIEDASQLNSPVELGLVTVAESPPEAGAGVLAISGVPDASPGHPHSTPKLS